MMRIFLQTILAFLTLSTFTMASTLTPPKLEIVPECSAYMLNSDFLKTRTIEKYKATITLDAIPYGDINSYSLRNNKDEILNLKTSNDLPYTMNNNTFKDDGKKLSFYIQKNKYFKYRIGDEYFTDLLNNDSLHLSINKNIKTGKKIIVTRGLLHSLRIKNRKDKYKDEYKDEVVPKDIIYPAFVNHRTTWHNAHEQCLQQIDDDKQQIFIEQLLILIGILIGLIILFFMLRALIRFIKRKAEVVKVKAKEREKETAERKIRNIAEEESIRASVRKSIDESNDNDLDDLQNLINKAVANGDSETAQALLKILNSKKNKI